METRADLLIVGAGMVGSALALALQDSGLNILLLDGGPLSVKPFDDAAAFEPRVSALSAASQRILERLDVWDGAIAVIARSNSAKLVAGEVCCEAVVDDPGEGRRRWGVEAEVSRARR